MLWGWFLLILMPDGPVGAHLASSGRGSPIKPGKPLVVINQVRHADFDARAGDTDGSDEQAHAVLLPSEHMLDCRADDGPLCIGPGGWARSMPMWFL